LTQHEPAALVANIRDLPDRHVVTVEVTVRAWTADEAAQGVRAFVSDVFARSEYKLASISALRNLPNGRQCSSESAESLMAGKC
jgi:hypothetical protein